MLSSAHALSCPDYPYQGAVCYTAATFCPKDYYAEANGAVLSIANNQALYSLIGVIYGGDGISTFKLPDLRGRTPVAQGTGVGTATRVQGSTYGTETVQLTTSQLPAHVHNVSSTVSVGASQASIPVSTNSGNQATPSGAVYLAASTIGDAVYTSVTPSGDGAYIPVTIPAGSVSISSNTQSTGLNQAFPISQPSTVLRACIAIKGAYPPRT